MNLIIGKVNFDVNHIIYVSPNGDDSNDGLTESTPIVSFHAIISKATDGDAIYFMPGEHTFTDDFVDIDNMLMIRDEGKKLLFYSQPEKTTLNFILTRGGPRYGRSHFFSLMNHDSMICNLLINIETNGPFTNVNGLFYQNLGSIKNCFITIRTPWHSIGGSHNGDNDKPTVIENTIFRFTPTNTFTIINYTHPTGTFIVKDCLISKEWDNNPKDNYFTNINTVVDASINDNTATELIMMAKSSQSYMYKGDLTLWNPSSYIIRINDKDYLVTSDQELVQVDYHNDIELLKTKATSLVNINKKIKELDRYKIIRIR